jgi:hypothetical protein
MQPKKEQKIDPAPTAIISWVESVFFPLPVIIAQYDKERLLHINFKAQ